MKVPLCKQEQIPEEGTISVDFLGREVLVYKHNNKPKAIVNICTHLGGPMKKEGEKLVCQWHGAEFDCSLGKCIKGPARLDSRLIILPTHIEDGVLTYDYGD